MRLPHTANSSRLLSYDKHRWLFRGRLDQAFFDCVPKFCYVTPAPGFKLRGCVEEIHPPLRLRYGPLALAQLIVSPREIWWPIKSKKLPIRVIQIVHVSQNDGDLGVTFSEG